MRHLRFLKFNVKKAINILGIGLGLGLLFLAYQNMTGTGNFSPNLVSQWQGLRSDYSQMPKSSSGLTPEQAAFLKNPATKARLADLARGLSTELNASGYQTRVDPHLLSVIIDGAPGDFGKLVSKSTNKFGHGIAIDTFNSLFRGPELRGFLKPDFKYVGLTPETFFNLSTSDLIAGSGKTVLHEYTHVIELEKMWNGVSSSYHGWCMGCDSMEGYEDSWSFDELKTHNGDLNRSTNEANKSFKDSGVSSSDRQKLVDDAASKAVRVIEAATNTQESARAFHNNKSDVTTSPHKLERGGSWTPWGPSLEVKIQGTLFEVTREVLGKARTYAIVIADADPNAPRSELMNRLDGRLTEMMSNSEAAIQNTKEIFGTTDSSGNVSSGRLDKAMQENRVTGVSTSKARNNLEVARDKNLLNVLLTDSSGSSPPAKSGPELKAQIQSEVRLSYLEPADAAWTDSKHLGLPETWTSSSSTSSGTANPGSTNSGAPSASPVNNTNPDVRASDGRSTKIVVRGNSTQAGSAVTKTVGRIGGLTLAAATASGLGIYADDFKNAKTPGEKVLVL
ncbi:MAG: hypothetical protein WCH11_07190, partial [Bdellovibrio sp.]